MPRYYITDPAAENIKEIWEGHIDRGGTPATADHLIDGLLPSFQNLADFPDIGRPRDYLPPSVLAFPHDDYMIFYRKVDHGVDILHVLYGGRDLRAFFLNP